MQVGCIKFATYGEGSQLPGLGTCYCNLVAYPSCTCESQGLAVSISDDGSVWTRLANESVGSDYNTFVPNN